MPIGQAIRLQDGYALGPLLSTEAIIVVAQLTGQLLPQSISTHGPIDRGNLVEFSLIPKRWSTSAKNGGQLFQELVPFHLPLQELSWLVPLHLPNCSSGAHPHAQLAPLQIFALPCLVDCWISNGALIWTVRFSTVLSSGPLVFHR